MIYLTGDIHGNPLPIINFCKKIELTKEDIIILLGDVGVNYYTGSRDNRIKAKLAKLPVTFLCIHGNHEIRPQNIPSYEPMLWNGGRVLVENKHPSDIAYLDIIYEEEIAKDVDEGYIEQTSLKKWLKYIKDEKMK